MNKHIIKLSDSERERLEAIIRKGKHSARVITRARVLLKTNAEVSDTDIAAEAHIVASTVWRIRKRYHEGGLDRALYDAKRSGTPRALSDEQEARLAAIACTDAPEGHRHWTIELLRDRLIHDKIVDSVATGTIHARLIERGIKPWREKNVVRAEAHA